MTITMEVLPRFPARVDSGPGIAVDRTNGVYTISADIGSVAPGVVTDPDSSYVLVQQPDGSYIKAPVAAVSGTADFVNVTDYGAVGDGLSNDAPAFLAAANSLNTRGFVLIPANNYSGITAAAVPTTKDVVWLNDSGVTNTFDLPGVQFGPVSNRLQATRANSADDDFATLAVFRTVNHAGGSGLNHGFYSATTVNAGVTGLEWAVTGVINTNNTAGQGSVAISGVANKIAGSIPQIWAGHFQGTDNNIEAAPDNVSTTTGVEINIQAVGLDRAANPFGARHCLVVASRTNQVTGWDTAPGNSGNAEIGAGILIKTDDLTDGYFRYGLIIDESVGNPNPINTGIYVSSHGPHGILVDGDHATAAIRLNGNDGVGLLLQGTYTSGNAIRIPTGQAIAMEATGALRFWNTGNIIAFGSATTERVGLDLTNGGSALRIAGTTVVGPRSTGWATQTAAAAKTDLGAAPTVNQIASYLSALNAALVAHGLIGV